MREAVAIIGMSGRFPGAPSIRLFWHNLRAGVESMANLSSVDSIADGADAAMLAASNYVNVKGVIDNIDQFDAAFFGFTRRGAEIVNPQIRLLLECVWETFESAGYVPDTYHGLCGTFVGGASNAYISHLQASREENALDHLEILTGNQPDDLATRTAYKLNLRGPAITILSACSTSLVAIAAACQSLLDGHCDMAVAGGVAIDIPHRVGYMHYPGGILSPDGHCRAFDRHANGTVPGNGLGVVLLKRLSEAIADGNVIHAIIRGTATNNDGSNKAGYHAPGVEGQLRVIALAHALGGTSPDSISYVECQGTGTILGDSIEIAALSQVFAQRPTHDGRCALGSVKTNIGHLSAAAGVAGLIKAVLALSHEELPPSLHFTAPNPHLDLEATPFFVNASLRAWPRGARPRRAGVSSFGIGGTNAHVVLEEAPLVKILPSRRPTHVVVLSARTASALEMSTDRLLRWIGETPDPSMADVALTLQVGRRAMTHRRAILCRDVDELREGLASPRDSRVTTGQSHPDDVKTTFLFSGQEVWYLGMGRELYDAEPIFRVELDACFATNPSLAEELRHVMLDDAGARSNPSDLDQTGLTQAALFCLELALARTWMSWGVVPVALLGHGVGEYVAACVAGIMSPSDALRVLIARGRLMQTCLPGAMLAVSLGESDVLRHCGRAVDVAAVDAPDRTVLAGSTTDIDAIERSLNAVGVDHARLRTPHAYHSRLMEPAQSAMHDVLQTISLRPPQIPIVSSISGQWLSDESATNPAYWASQVRRCVRFGAALATLCDLDQWALVEIGLGTTLTTLARRHLGAAHPHPIVPSLPSHPQAGTDSTALLRSLSRLWVAGVPVNWGPMYDGERRQRVELPTYPFERERFWVDAPQRAPTTAQIRDPESLRSPDAGHWFSVRSWVSRPSPITPAAAGPLATDRWLIFDNEQTAVGSLGTALESVALTVHVTIGARFQQLGPRRYAVRAAEHVDYLALLKALHDEGATVSRVVHTWSATDAECESSVRAFAATQERGFYSLIALGRALVETQPGRAVRIDVVTTGLHDVLGDDVTIPSHATVIGACRCIPLEYPNLRYRVIDVAALDLSSADHWRKSVLSELLSTDESDCVALRNGRRWVESFSSLSVPKPSVASVRPLRERGVYLITGGLGRIGLAIASCFADDARARLCLVGRTGVPDRAEWKRWLASHARDDVTSRRILAIGELEARGSEVLVLEADIGDPNQARRVVDAARRHFGALHGVVHGAAPPRDGVYKGLRDLTRTDCEIHFAAKAYGIMNLQAAVGATALDFWILLSCLSAITGHSGFTASASANAFLDALAQSHRDIAGERWFATDWDDWTFAESTEAPTLADHAMLPQDGIDALRRVLAYDLRSTIVSTTPLDARLAHRARARVLPLADDLERTVAETWQNLLGISAVGREDDFFDLGGDSLLATQVAARLRRSLAVDIPIRAFFDKPTVAGLAEVIRGFARDAQRPAMALPQLG